MAPECFGLRALNPFQGKREVAVLGSHASQHGAGQCGTASASRVSETSSEWGRAGSGQSVLSVSAEFSGGKFSRDELGPASGNLGPAFISFHGALEYPLPRCLQDGINGIAQLRLAGDFAVLYFQKQLRMFC